MPGRKTPATDTESAKVESGKEGGADNGTPLDYAGEHGLKTSESGGLADPAAPIDWTQHLSPEEMREIDQATQQNVNPGEILVSRLAMMQALSPEIKDRSAGYDQGQIIDNNTREVYSVKSVPPWMVGKVPDVTRLEEVDHVRFVPIAKLPNEYIRWKRRNTEGTGWWWKTLDPHEVVDLRQNMMAGDPVMRAAGRGTFKGGWQAEKGAEVKSPPTTENLNILGIIINEDGSIRCPMVIATFAKTSYTYGKKLVSALNLQRANRVPYFGRFYYLWAHYETFGENKCYTLDVAQGLATPNNPDLIRIAIETAKYLSDKELGKARQEGMIASAVDYYEDESGPGDPYAGSGGDTGYVPSEAEAAAAASGGKGAPMGGDPRF